MGGVWETAFLTSFRGDPHAGGPWATVQWCCPELFILVNWPLYGLWLAASYKSLPATNLFNKYFMSTDSMPDTALGTANRVRTKECSLPCEAHTLLLCPRHYSWHHLKISMVGPSRNSNSVCVKSLVFTLLVSADPSPDFLIPIMASVFLVQSPVSVSPEGYLFHPCMHHALLILHP